MKKSVKKVISLLLLITMICGMSVSAYASEATYVNSLEEEKALMLDIVKEQLGEQDAMRFYPIYEQMIDQMYTPITRSESQKYFPAGGVIYYENYLNTGVEMMNTYYSDTAYHALIDGDPIPGAFIDLVANLTIGLASKSAAILMAGCSFATVYQMEKIEEAGGAYLCVTEDHEGFAKTLLPWKNHPYATYYEGAEITSFKRPK